MFLIRAIQRKVAWSNAVFDAKHGHSGSLIKALEKNFDFIHKRDPLLKHTLLQLSFIHNNPSCVITLLERGADPNLSYGFSSEKDTPLESAISSKDKSSIRILMSYGAIYKGLVLPYDREIAHVISHMQQLYGRLEQLKKEPKTPEVYQQISTIWQQLHDEENDISDYKAHYQQKSNYYRHRAEAMLSPNLVENARSFTERSPLLENKRLSL